MSDCSICYDPVIDFPEPEATGSHRSSCGHLFHPKCIAKWHTGQEHSTCPMCRKVAVEMEDCAIEEEEDEDEEDEEDERVLGILARADAGEFDGGGVIRVSRASLEYILREAGGVGMTAGVEAEIEINEFNEVVIERFELARILQEQGGTPLSDAQWSQLTSVYPPAEYNDDDEVVAGAMALVAPPQLTFAPSADEQPDPTQRARYLLANPEPPASVVTPEDAEAWALVLDSARATIARHAAAERHPSSQHPCPLEFFVAGDIPPTYGVAMSVPCDICKAQQITIPFYHCSECHFDVCAECFKPPAADTPGPFDAGEPHRFTFRRADIQRLLQTHGSTATVEEFFNEEMGGDEEETLVVTMTLESLNNRFASLGALLPVTFMEAIIAVATINRETLQIISFADDTRDVVIKERVILNPEDEEL
jgi:hypothetical protein